MYVVHVLHMVIFDKLHMHHLYQTCIVITYCIALEELCLDIQSLFVVNFSLPNILFRKRKCVQTDRLTYLELYFLNFILSISLFLLEANFVYFAPPVSQIHHEYLDILYKEELLCNTFVVVNTRDGWVYIVDHMVIRHVLSVDQYII